MQKSTFYFLCLLLFVSATTYSQSVSWHSTNFPLQNDGWFTSIVSISPMCLFAGTQPYVSNLPEIIRSLDGGRDWQRVLRDTTQPPGGPVAITTNSQGHVFAVLGYRLFRSTDYGESWVELNPPERYNPGRLLSTPTGDLFAATGHMHFSSDDGDTWVSRDDGLPSTLVNPWMTVSSARRSFYTIFLIAGLDTSRLYKSSDNGLHWVRDYGFPQISDECSLVVARGGTLFLSAILNGKLYRSTDDGNSWRIVFQGRPGPVLTTMQGNVLLGLVQTNPAPVYRSSDNGDSWQLVSTLIGRSVASLTQAEDGSIFAGCEEGGLFRSSDEGTSWTQINQGIPSSSSHVVSIAKAASGTVVAGTDKYGAFQLTGMPPNWTRVSNAMNPLSLAVDRNGNFWAAVGQGMKSTDDGITWQTLQLPGYQTSVSAKCIQIARNGTIYFGTTVSASYMSLIRSSDGGQSWSSILNFEAPDLTAFLALHVSDVNSILAGYRMYTYERAVLKSHYHTYVSAYGGATWKQVVIGSDATEPRGYTSTRDNTLFAATSAGVYVSSDTGNTWTSANNGIPMTDIRCITVDKSDLLFVGTGGSGVYCSADRGKNWTPLNSFLTDSVITSLICDDDGLLIAGTWNNGVFRTSRATAVEGERPSLPSRALLLQNYPNPFNPSSVIRYHLPKLQAVKLKVFNLPGQVVETLVDEVKSAGSYEVEWIAKVPSGVYFYRLEAGAYVETRKMVLIR